MRARTVVVGCGLMGITTAYFLRRKGYEVTVLDRADGPARETSFANGSMLTLGMAEPWNAPGSWRVLLTSFGRPDSALQLHLGVLPSLADWGIRFLRNSTPARYERNASNIVRLAAYSREVMESLRRETAISYGRSARGSLSIFRKERGFVQACATAEGRAGAGLRHRKLSPRETIELEPALAPIVDNLCGAIYYDTDETGDARRFCEALTDKAREQGVEFCFGTDVSSLETRSGEVTAAVSGQKRFEADRFVVAAGSYSPLLLRSVGINLPIRPAKGYTITFPDAGGQPLLQMPIIDSELHVVFVPLEGAVRLAGIAEFAGYDRRLDRARIRSVLNALPMVLPNAHFDHATATPWCGLRPSSADGVAVIGPTPIPNLWVNSGQGHLGWTTAAGSAQLFADLFCGTSPAIDAAPYALRRFNTF